MGGTKSRVECKYIECLKTPYKSELFEGRKQGTRAGVDLSNSVATRKFSEQGRETDVESTLVPTHGYPSVYQPQTPLSLQYQESIGQVQTAANHFPPRTSDSSYLLGRLSKSSDLSLWGGQNWVSLNWPEGKPLMHRLGALTTVNTITSKT